MPRVPGEFGIPPEESWTDANGPTEERRRLKAQLHQQIVTRMDLSVLGAVSQDRLRAEVRRPTAPPPPLALAGALVSSRRFGARPLQAADLVARAALTEEMLRFLSACITGRLNLLISGGTGSGKTTLLNCLSAFIPDEE